MTPASRSELLTQLLTADGDLAAVARALSRFPWDSEHELVVLTVAHVRAVLSAFVAGRMSVASVDLWANLIEGRDDVGFAPADAELLRALIFRLANPELHAPMTVAVAVELLGEFPV